MAAAAETELAGEIDELDRKIAAGLAEARRVGDTHYECPMCDGEGCVRCGGRGELSLEEAAELSDRIQGPKSPTKLQRSSSTPIPVELEHKWMSNKALAEELDVDTSSVYKAWKNKHRVKGLYVLRREATEADQDGSSRQKLGYVYRTTTVAPEGATPRKAPQKAKPRKANPHKRDGEPRKKAKPIATYPPGELQTEVDEAVRQRMTVKVKADVLEDARKSEPEAKAPDELVAFVWAVACGEVDAHDVRRGAAKALRSFYS